MKNKTSYVFALTLTLLSISNVSNAAFLIKIPMQETSGGMNSGSLPEGSIRFVKAGDGSGLPPTEVITPEPPVQGGSDETEYSEEQSCLQESNANSAKALIEQYQYAVFGGLFYNVQSVKGCIAHAYLPKNRFDAACKVSNGSRLNAVISNMNLTQFEFTYELTGGC